MVSHHTLPLSPTFNSARLSLSVSLSSSPAALPRHSTGLDEGINRVGEQTQRLWGFQGPSEGNTCVAVIGIKTHFPPIYMVSKLQPETENDDLNGSCGGDFQNLDCAKLVQELV